MPAAKNKNRSAAAKTDQQPEERSFIVTVKGNACRLENGSFTDFEIVGILTALLSAYNERFGKGDSENGQG